MSETRELVARLQKRVDSWSRNSGDARLSVPLGELRAVLADNDKLRRGLMGLAMFTRPPPTNKEGKDGRTG